MLLPSTNELWTPTSALPPELLDPERTKDEAYLSDMLDFVRRVVPFENGSLRYRADEAEGLGGNCYAQTDATVGVSAQLDVGPNFIMLSADHASNLTRPLADTIYLEAGYPEDYRVLPVPNASKYSLLTEAIKAAHRKFIEQAEELGSAACYFWSDGQKVYSQMVDTIADDGPTHDDTEDIADLHLLVTAAEGVDTLHAIGDLKRYRSRAYTDRNGTDRFEEAWSELKDQIPTFINIPAPKSSLAPV